MGIQYIGGQSSAYFPSYTAQGAASGTAMPRPASTPASTPTPENDSGNPVQQPTGVPLTYQQHLEEAAAQVQSQLKDAGVELKFSFNKEAGKTIVKMIDPSTQEVIRQMPSTDMLAIAQNLDKRIQGMLISQKV
jgi:flagellar protein FlaG